MEGHAHTRSSSFEPPAAGPLGGNNNHNCINNKRSNYSTTAQVFVCARILLNCVCGGGGVCTAGFVCTACAQRDRVLPYGLWSRHKIHTCVHEQNTCTHTCFEHSHKAWLRVVL